jgi:two-component system response regulator
VNDVPVDIAPRDPDAPIPIILVAEDDAHHRFVLRRVFRTVGLEADLRFVQDGQELLDYLEHRGIHADEATSPWPDLVLIDLHMPRLGGIATLQAMRASATLRTVPAIVFSSSDQPHHIERAYASGANAYLVKVGDFKDLVSHLRGMVSFWLRAAKLPRRPAPSARGPGEPPA